MPTLHRAVCFTVLTLLAAVGLAIPGSSPAGAVETGTISGSVVTDDENHYAMSSLSVTAYLSSGSGWEWAASDHESSSGHFELTGLAPGTYRLFIQNETGLWRSEWYDDASSLATASDIALGAGATVTADAELARSTSITGQLSDGVNVYAGISVVAYHNVDGAWQQTGTGGYTSEGGRYFIGDLANGTYRVCSVGTANYLSRCYGGETVGSATDVVAGPDGAPNIDFDLAPAAFVTGEVRVWDAVNGRDELARADVTAYRLDEGTWTPVGLATTRGGTFDYGRYDLGGLPAGTYRLGAVPPEELAEYYKPRFYPNSDSVAGASDVVVPAGGLVQNIQFVLQPSRAFTLTQAPSLAGTPQVGKRLTAKPAVWTPTPEDITYTWKANGNFAAETAGPTWTPTIKQVGKRISVTVTALGTHMRFHEVTTGQTSPVAPGQVGNASVPAISGKAEVGRTLSVSRGRWTPTKVTLKYQWLAKGVPIRGATQATYKLKAGQRGKKISVRVTASAPSYRPTSVKTKATGKVKA